MQKKIEKLLKLKYQRIPNYTILNILKNFRKVIIEFIKYNYKLHQIGGPPEEECTVAIDETLITNDNGEQIWLVGDFDTTKKTIRLAVMKERNSTNLKNFVQNHITPRN